jgi:hypothetical protein
VGGDARFVELANRRHRLGRDRRDIACRAVGLRLSRILGARDDRGHCLLHKDPAERELRHGDILRDQSPQLVDGLQRQIIGHAGKGFALVEGFAVAVERAVVVCSERRVLAHLAGEEAGCERHADDHRNVPRLGLAEEEASRPLAEDVVDDLHRDDA